MSAICSAEKHPQAYTCRRCKGILDRVYAHVIPRAEAAAADIFAQAVKAA